VFEAAIGARLEHAKEIGSAHPRDHIGVDAACGLGLLRALARDERDVARTGDEFGDVGSVERHSETRYATPSCPRRRASTSSLRSARKACRHLARPRTRRGQAMARL